MALKCYAQAMTQCTIFLANRTEWGCLLLDQSKFDQAETQFREILKYNPEDGNTHIYLAEALVYEGNLPAAIEQYRIFLKLMPDSPSIDDYLADLLTTSADEKLKNPAEAIQYARHACQLTLCKNTGYLDTLSAAYAEAGRFADAIPVVRRACANAATLGETNELEHNRLLLSFYQHQLAVPKPAEKLVPAAP